MPFEWAGDRSVTCGRALPELPGSIGWDCSKARLQVAADKGSPICMQSSTLTHFREFVEDPAWSWVAHQPGI